MLLILHSLSSGIYSFNAIKKDLGSISSRTLSERLRELEGDGFVKRVVTHERPVKIKYHSTEKFRSFEKYLIGISEWAKAWSIKTR